MHTISDYNYELPSELLAKTPAEKRDESRLMLVNRAEQRIEHYTFKDLPSLLNSGDCLVMNNTKVLRARLFGKRASTGGKWEGLFLSSTDDNWRLIGETRGKLQPGEQLTLHPAHDPGADSTLTLTLLSKDDEGTWTARPESTIPTEELLTAFGTLPLPPYIGRKLAVDNDFDRYQTTYAKHAGAVAAPTAGLHFTEELLQQLRHNKVCINEVTLHVGIGTFRPISVENLNDHQMHSEWCRLPDETATAVRNTQSNNDRVIAVGTTSVRTLESAAANGRIQPWSGSTNLFIKPGYQFKAVDGLITNFHLPKSSLLVLVSAFAGYDLIKQAYEIAINEKYRFYSYGDAMLIL